MASAIKIYKHFETPKKEGVYHRLVCLTGEKKGEAYYLMGKRIVMGRSDNCDITILDLKSSREHAEIIMVGKEYILTDLGSQNGIVINDLKIKQHALSDGDKIIVGKTVYKFSKVIVKEEDNSSSKQLKNKNIKKSSESDDYEDDDEYETEVEPKNKRLTLLLGAVIFIGLILLLTDDSNDEGPNRSAPIEANVKEIDDSFSKAIKARNIESKKNKAKLAVYFKRGLREYREGNYFRAISEFESAQQWSPNDPLANFYLRKTREKLDEQIESYFSKAIRDEDAVNYMKAITSYCAVVRLLNDFNSDQRFIAAKEGINNLEQKMGMDEGEIVCIDKSKEEE